MLGAQPFRPHLQPPPRPQIRARQGQSLPGELCANCLSKSSQLPCKAAPAEEAAA